MKFFVFGFAFALFAAPAQAQGVDFPMYSGDTVSVIVDSQIGGATKYRSDGVTVINPRTQEEYSKDDWTMSHLPIGTIVHIDGSLYIHDVRTVVSQSEPVLKSVSSVSFQRLVNSHRQVLELPNPSLTGNLTSSVRTPVNRFGVEVGGLVNRLRLAEKSLFWTASIIPSYFFSSIMTIVMVYGSTGLVALLLTLGSIMLVVVFTFDRWKAKRHMRVFQPPRIYPPPEIPETAADPDPPQLITARPPESPRPVLVGLSSEPDLASDFADLPQPVRVGPEFFSDREPVPKKLAG